MKTTYFFMTALFILIFVMLFSQNIKEGFLQDYCSNYKSCMDCSNASGCSWCPKGNVCLTSTVLKSTDKICNQMNTISSSFRCNSTEDVDLSLPEEIASNNVLYDFSLYKNRITDKIPPPNMYMSGAIKVSNEDLLSNTNDVRNDITNYKIEMPSIIASSVENQIKPMVKGILSENYYIQGFEDINANTQCQTHNSCSGCVNDKKCGWNPRSYNCEKKGLNNMWQIIQPSKCILTPTTIGNMIKRPAGNV